MESLWKDSEALCLVCRNCEWMRYHVVDEDHCDIVVRHYVNKEHCDGTVDQYNGTWVNVVRK